MKERELSALTDEELLQAAKKMKSDAIISALLIGFMIGIIVWSVAKNTVGFFTLIPLFFIFKVFHKPKTKNELKKILKERNLN